MRRRELIAGAAGLAVAGAGAAVALGGVRPFGDDVDAIAEHELESIEAPGSEAGTVTVPRLGTVTLVEVFATWCGVCSEQMGPMGEAYDAVGGDVQVVSVTNEPLGRTTTHEDVARWWADHGGRWTVAHDTDLELSRELDATGVPLSLVLDESNVVTWSELGRKPADELVAAVDDARGG